MEQRQALVEFRIDGVRYALAADRVDRVVNMVMLTPLPGAPDVVTGVIDVAGELVPAVSVRRRLGGPEKDLSPGSFLCLARTRKRAVALIVDEVTGVVEYRDHELTPAGEIFPDLQHLEGIARLEGGLVLVSDLDAFLSLEEHRRISAAIKKAGGKRNKKC